MLRRTRKRLQQGLQWLWEQEGTPGQRARGLAAGIFCGCFPIFGLQTLAGITLASVVRGNHLLAAAGTWISNPFTYVPLYWFNYRIGALLAPEVNGPVWTACARRASVPRDGVCSAACCWGPASQVPSVQHWAGG